MGRRSLVSKGTALTRDEITLLKLKAFRYGLSPIEQNKRIDNLKKYLKKEVEMMKFKNSSIESINQMREDVVQKAFMEFEPEELE